MKRTTHKQDAAPIETLRNVPLTKAAEYLHCSTDTLRALLIRPNSIGYAVEVSADKPLRYLIPGPRLVKWVNGELMTDGNQVTVTKALHELLDAERGLKAELKT